MTNSIVGQSRDRMKQIEKQNQSKSLQIQLNELFQDQLDSHEDRIVNLEDTMRVNGVQEMKITNAVNRTVVTYLGGKSSQAYQDKSLRSRCYSSINREIKDKFGIPRRSELPAKDYERCLDFINNWILDHELVEEIGWTNNSSKRQE